MTKTLKATSTDRESISDAVHRVLHDYFDSLGEDPQCRGLYHHVVREVEQVMFMLTLKASNGNQLRAAEMLGLHRNTLRKKMSDLGLDLSKASSSR